MDKLIGVPPITITRLDGDTYINCTNQIDQGAKGSLAVYKDDNQAITHTGVELTWDEAALKLTTENIKINNKVEAIDGLFSGSVTTGNVESLHLHVEEMITTSIIKSDILKNSDYLSSNKVAVNKWLSFTDSNEDYRFNIHVGTNDDFPEEVLCFTADNEMMLGFDSKKTYLPTTLNIEHRTINDPIGYKQDLKGDVCIDDNYFYHCVANYNGEDKIWKRVLFEGW